MVKSKAPKKKARGVDFKKYKKKVGRKLPPSQNATNTEIKSKAIVLPEQSLAIDRSGIAVNKRGLTLRELLQQTSHHSPKIRRGALNGIKDLLLKHPSELKLHNHSIIEKLRERVCDNDKGVRDALYDLFKFSIFPSLKGTLSKLSISPLMLYILNAMTNITMEVRLMGFKFFELVAFYYPSSLPEHLEKVLDNYAYILRNNHIYLQDRSKLITILNGLVQSLSLFVDEGDKKVPANFKSLQENKFSGEEFLLSSMFTDPQNGLEGLKKLKDLILILVNCFHDSASIIRVNLDVGAEIYESLLSTVECISLSCKLCIREVMKRPCSGDSRFPSHGSEWMRSAILAHLRKLWEIFPLDQDQISSKKVRIQIFSLNVKIANIYFNLSPWMDSPVIDKFLEFLEVCLYSQVEFLPAREQKEKNIGYLLPFVPTIMPHVSDQWRIRLLESFTDAFMKCRVESALMLMFLSAIETMLLPGVDDGPLPDLFDYSDCELAWVFELPHILLQANDKYSSISKATLKLIRRIGQCTRRETPRSLEFDKLQGPLKEFYYNKSTLTFGPFVKLPPELQEEAIFCLYHFSNIDPEIVESLTCCCLCEEVEPHTVFRIIEVLQLSYKAGSLHISFQANLLVTLAARFKVHPEKLHIEQNTDDTSNLTTFKALIHVIFTYLSQMGDGSLVLKLLWGTISDEMARIPPLANRNALLRMVVALDHKTAGIMDEKIRNLANWMASYMVDSAFNLSFSVDMDVNSDKKFKELQYHLKPCNYLLDGNDRVVTCTIELLKLFIFGEWSLLHSQFASTYGTEVSNRVFIVTSILNLVYVDGKVRGCLSSSSSAVKGFLLDIKSFLDSNASEMKYGEKKTLYCAFEQLKNKACVLHSWKEDEFGAVYVTS